MGFSFRKRLQSFKYAIEGLRAVLRTEHNTWIHLALTILVVLAGFLLQVSRTEWVALVLVFALVWVAEIFNTVLEKLADLYTTERHPKIKIIKDMAAGAVLVAAIAALLVGCLVFGPRLLQLL